MDAINHLKIAQNRNDVLLLSTVLFLRPKNLNKMVESTLVQTNILNCDAMLT